MYQSGKKPRTGRGATCASTTSSKITASTRYCRMQVDIKYIKEKIESVEDIRDVATDARASAKSAHKRLDEHLRYDHHKDIPNREE